MSAPKPDEVEISLFGPGYGECVIIHPGDGHWIIVDSCIYPQSKEPAALRYLSRIGVDPASSVQLVIASHWHDDHIRGLGRLFRECESAQFVCSEALTIQEFAEVVYAQGTRFLSHNISGVDEFREILDELKRRALVSGRRHLPPLFAIAERCLWQMNIASMGVDCEVHALSPSDGSLMASKMNIAKLMPKSRNPKRVIWPSGKNHAAIALWISVGDRLALLGADLEETENPDTGWQVIVDSSRRPRGKATVFKVPHHGSKTGHNSDVWASLLDNQPAAILSPYNLGGKVLPTRDDIERICSYTNSGFITTRMPPRARAVRRDSAVEKTLKELGLSPRQVNIDVGHIRLRAKQGSPWDVELNDSAQRLCNLES